MVLYQRSHSETGAVRSHNDLRTHTKFILSIFTVLIRMCKAKPNQHRIKSCTFSYSDTDSAETRKYFFSQLELANLLTHQTAQRI